MPKKEKTFDAIAWTRQVRDELHRKYSDVPDEEFVRKVAEEGRETELWKELARKHRPGEKA